MAGNVLMLVMVHSIVPEHNICLQILNFFSISEMNETTLFKFGK